MSAHDLPPLDPDIASLLDRAKTIDDLDGAHKSALLGAVEAKLALPPPGGGGGGGGRGGAGGVGTSLGAKMAAALAVTFAAGVGVGVAGDRAFAPPNVAPAPTTTVVTVAPSVTSSAAPVVEAPDVPVSALPAVSAPARPLASPAAGEGPSAKGLAAERALLDVARSALARGEAAEALAAADRHAREYPDGALAEEREAIAIKALVALGRRDEARARLRELERKHPNSLVLRAVKSAVEGTP